ncbi:hypothetical protein KDJ56_15260 [Brevibacillus composti]|uniref:Phosphatase n=1 Tax=Brevibacillus composti TaxID=2796470 RepID=A0A7T5EII5_9BACL|nr:hypothetical protein [Brevibacillus composti]QQE73266.1 hypothetical protein JD108_15315 [Brevibacillus composti]QUO40347.1 hypothetical protein KDJ56_15260 [Brevibacillus composti]
MKKILTGILVLLMTITMVTPVLGATKDAGATASRPSAPITTFDIDPGY